MNGYNLGTDATSELTDPSDQFNKTVVPGALDDNGGGTQTHAILVGGTAVVIDPVGLSGAPATDQRDAMRDGAPDINAYEANVTLPLTNSSPTLADTVVNLGPVDEDAGSPFFCEGTLISSLVDFPGGGGQDNVTGPDAGAVTGIAITAADTTNGSWL